MCGIFGWSLNHRTSVSRRRLKAAFDVLCAGNDSRGGHSYGFFVNDDEMIHKGLGECAHVPFERGAVWPFRSRQFFGHTRRATHGKVSVKNAHPFHVGHIVGAHNGIIYNHDALNKRLGRDFDVDSMHVFAHLDAHKSLADIDGYGAIEWIDDRKPHQTMLARFDGELSVAEVKGVGVFWSSDAEHLRIALTVARLTGTVHSIKDQHIYRVAYGKMRETKLTLDIARTQAFGWSAASASAAHGWTRGDEWDSDDDRLIARMAVDQWPENAGEDDERVMRREFERLTRSDSKLFD